MRQPHHVGQQRIGQYLFRHHQIKISSIGIYWVLKRNSLNRLPRNQRKRSVPDVKRYEKQEPGHHVSVNVTFLKFKDQDRKTLKRFQYTAINDATRIRTLKIYERRTQQNTISLVDYIIEKFPFPINTIRTDNSHEFRANVHWGLEDPGIRPLHIKPRTPRLNGKVKRSHDTDQRECCQLLTYKNDVDLDEKP